MVDKTGIGNYNSDMVEKKKGTDKTGKTLKKKAARTSDKIYFSHNNFFTAFFEEKEVVESFLTEYVPKEITRDLDFNTLEIERENFVNKKLRRHFSDILYSIQFKKKPAYAYLLFEHKSREKKKKKKFAPFQLLKYMVHIWDRHLKLYKEIETLPPIIPMVFYHGKEKWNVRTDFLSLFDVPQSMAKYIPQFDFELHDISHTPDESIRGNILLQILMLTFKYIFNPELVHKLKIIFSLLKELDDEKRGDEYLEILLRYLLSRGETLSVEDLRETVDDFFEEGGNLMPTIAQQFVAQGREETKWHVARNSLRKGLDMRTISEITELSVEEIKRLKSEMDQEKTTSH